jgi:hypothetical protein
LPCKNPLNGSDRLCDTIFWRQHQLSSHGLTMVNPELRRQVITVYKGNLVPGRLCSPGAFLG